MSTNTVSGNYYNIDGVEKTFESFKFEVLNGITRINTERYSSEELGIENNEELVYKLHLHPIYRLYNYYQDRKSSPINEEEKMRSEMMLRDIEKVFQNIYNIMYAKTNLEIKMNNEILNKIKNIRVGITYSFAFGIFKSHYPSLTLIKNTKDVCNYDLIIVPGGEDINPSIYGAHNKFCEVNKNRDEIEVPIVTECLHLKKKLFGICRGHQLINALVGCTFVQDIFNEGFESHPSLHGLQDISNNGIIPRFFGKKEVVSLHHQGISGSNLYITSFYKRIAESTENKYILTTQFHPEFQEDNEKFFEYLKYWAFDYHNLYKF